eukprot:3553919-Rhodomonas_salina.1
MLVNARLRRQQVDFLGPQHSPDTTWWQQQDEWAWARAQMLPDIYIDPQTTVPGDHVSVRCKGQGGYVAVPLAQAGLPTQCECDQCQDIRQKEAIHQHNEYQEAKRTEFFADNARVRAIHAAEREEAERNVESKKWSSQDEVAATDLAERQARAGWQRQARAGWRLAAEQHPSLPGTVASGESGDKGKTPRRAGQGLLGDESGSNVSGAAEAGDSKGKGKAPRRAMQGTPAGGASRGAAGG